MNTLIVWLIVTCAAYRSVFAKEDVPEVKIPQGLLKGVYGQAWKGKPYSAFTGIPYAKPPIGELRFEPALPVEPWEGTLDATKSHAVCLQINVLTRNYVPHGEEDCLYLNVYTPLKGNYESYKLPVMVFIHGGAWTCGDGNRESYGPDYLLEEDVLLVVINYRVGAFGFLSTEDDIVPGNNGLKDQVLALHWVNKNIKHFGGDSKKVTIFGQSAGAVSVSLHLFSPLSRGLFNGAIAQSGSALASWATAKPGVMIQNAKKLAELLNCSAESNYEMVKCLKNVDPLQIADQDLKFYRVCGDLHSISQTTACRIIKAISEVLSGNLGHYIKFLHGLGNIGMVRQQFFQLARFPGVIGCLDGTHIEIRSPGGPIAEDYRNRKSWMSIDVQVVADPNVKIFNIVIRWPGSTHDSRIFNSSSLELRSEQHRLHGIILDDNGYPQLAYFYTPMTNPQTRAEIRYNTAQVSTRNVVERTFGQWKQIFRCLNKSLNYNLRTTLRIIDATAVLHNIAIMEHELFVPDPNSLDGFVTVTAIVQNTCGNIIRVAFIARHFAN